jgi:hypothetical protein
MDVTVRNAILYEPTGLSIFVSPGVNGQGVSLAPDVLANSLTSGPAWANKSWVGTDGNIDADPLFVNASGGDYHLAGGSPAINAGTTIGAPRYDLDGAPRDARPDIGAYEYGAAPRPLLTVTVDPLGGNGTITSNPAAISCGITCSARLGVGTKVTLTARSDSRSRFLGWRGACDSRKTLCTITLNRAKTVTARFGPR